MSNQHRNALRASRAGWLMVAGGLFLNGSAQAIVPVPAVKPDPTVVAAVPVPQAAPEAPESAARKAPELGEVRRDGVASKYFSALAKPAPLPPQAIGSYAKGCQAGAVPLPADGPGYQVMRLERNRFWGQPELIDYLQDLARDAPKLGWRGLLVGDMSQPRGGPMPSGHSSHQIGLDADIWLKQMPEHRMSREERANVSAVSMLRGPLNTAGADRTVDPAKFTDAHARLLRRAAQDPRVARIFVTPGIKKALCEFETGDRSWLRVIRPWWGHHYHFHVRLKCPSGDAACTDQAPPPPGDGCGRPLDDWLADGPWVPKPGAKPGKRRPPLTVAQLPKSCMKVVTSR